MNRKEAISYGLTCLDHDLVGELFHAECTPDDEFALPPLYAERLSKDWILIPVCYGTLASFLRDKRNESIKRTLYFQSPWWYEVPSLVPVMERQLIPQWICLSRKPTRYVRSLYVGGAPNHRVLNASELFYVLLVLRSFGIALTLPTKEFMFVAHNVHLADPAYMFWRLSDAYVFNTFNEHSSAPRYVLSEFQHA